MLVDTHCHLNDARFADDWPSALARARTAGVERVVVVGCDMPSSESAVAMASSCSDVYAAVGVHPHDARSWSNGAMDRLRELASNPRVVAIGEIGLDYHYDFSPPETQPPAFVDQLRLAKELGLPVIIHCREAYSDTLEILEAIGAPVDGVMHCWYGPADMAKRAIDLGLYLGIGGMVTFRKSGELRTFVRDVRGDRLLLETDAPYMAPVPFRGKRNEPAYVARVAEAVAQKRGVSTAELVALTGKNTLRLFPRLH